MQAAGEENRYNLACDYNTTVCQKKKVKKRMCIVCTSKLLCKIPGEQKRVAFAEIVRLISGNSPAIQSFSLDICV